MTKEKLLQGIGVGEGIAIGKLGFLQEQTTTKVPEFAITAAGVRKEIHRFRRAIHESIEDLEKLEVFLAREGSNDAIQIVHSHIQMLSDPLITKAVEEKIQVLKKNTESVFHSTIEEYKKFFNQSATTSEKVRDLEDLSQMIMKHLENHEEISMLDEELRGKIVCCYELASSKAALASVSEILGFVTEIGSETSHAGLIAKASGIPYVSHVSIKDIEAFEGADAIIDGFSGAVIIFPSPKTLRLYEEKNQKYLAHLERLQKSLPKVVHTIDGKMIAVGANVKSLKDMQKLHEYNISHVGLLRSEFFYFKARLELFDEEEQFILYKKIFQEAKGKNIAFRLFDLGSDKKFFVSSDFEQNPALGMRSIRLLLNKPDFLLSQLRALFRAGKNGHFQILLPFVTAIEELFEVLEYIEIVKEELHVKHPIPLGCMIEVPSILYALEEIAPYVDFFSIGTNDLMQYAFALDRSHAKMMKKYGPMHPALLRMIDQIVQIAKKHRKPVSICGELASNRFFIPALLGLGLRSFSCSTRFVPTIKEALQVLSTKEAEIIANQCLKARTSHEVCQILAEKFQPAPLF